MTKKFVIFSNLDGIVKVDISFGALSVFIGLVFVV